MKKLILAVAMLTTIVGCSPTNTTPRMVSLIPMPQSITVNEGSFMLKAGSTVALADTSLTAAAQYFIENIERSNGLKLRLTDEPTGDIVLKTGFSNSNSEAYSMVVNAEGITVNGVSAIGIIRAASTLSQLLPNSANGGAAVAAVEIEDYPRFEWRGIMLDVSRHFEDVASVKKVLDMMARYKLNKFHWHLTDDQGWRVEIKQYPDLVGKGSLRKWNNQDSMCFKYATQYDDPDFNMPEKYLKIENGDTLYGGFYTQDEIRDVVAYAATRGIDVIPELDMPGHMLGAIVGYPWLSCNNKAQWGAGFSEPICLGNDSAIVFVKNIYSEIASLFPYEYMNLGADEVERVTWSKCPKCQARIKSEGMKGVEELQAWFVHDMDDYFKSLGKKLIGWDEIIDGGLSPTATILWWRDWAPTAVPQATAQGNKAIIAPCFTMYLDAWENGESLEKNYAFDPILPGLSEAQAANILGLQGNLWCETIPSMRRVEHQLFPRMMSIAEIGWSANDKKDWEGFKKRMVNEIDWLDAHKINYRIPNLTGFDDINAFTDSTSIAVQCILPNVVVRYTTDGTMPSAVSPILSEPLHITESGNYIFRGFRPDGTAGETFNAEYRKESFAAPDNTLSPTADGIVVKHYDYKGVYNDKQCAKIDGAKLNGQYVLESINLSKEIAGFMGLVATGYINIEADGIYSFSLKCNDGGTLAIDDVMLIDNDGTHGDKEMKAQKALGAGWHKVEVRFFDLNNGGMLRLMMNDKILTGFKH